MFSISIIAENYMNTILKQSHDLDIQLRKISILYMELDSP